MKWYEGGIAEAVSLSRKNNSIFVVYVEGKDDKSSKLTEIINVEEVSTRLEEGTFVAIKIEADSVPHQQFSEIYKEVNVPSVYFIGKSGAPLEIIEQVNDVTEFIHKIDDILRKNGSPMSSSTTNKSKVTSDFILHETRTEAINKNANKSDDKMVINSEAVSSSKSGGDDLQNVLQHEERTETKSSSEPETISEPQTIAGPATTETAIIAEPKLFETELTTSSELTSNSVPNNNTEFGTSTESEVSPEEKVERAKNLIEKKRQEKRQEEEETEKNKEIERRKMGQDVQKLKRWQQDQELKNVIEEREKEKKEQQAARQRILAQIEQDKADRAARFSSSPQTSQPQSSSQVTPRTPTNNNIARLQFKLPDGSSHTHEFSISSTLLEVRNYIKSNLNLSFNNFVLAMTFPRREFTSADDSQTLQDLELVPTAVILILPISHGTVASNPSTFTTFFWYLIAPILGIFGYLKNMIFTGHKPPSTSTSQENKRSFDTTSDSSRPLPKRRAAETSVIRRQGNVHRLTDKSDSDDENNTWNGNSTQQM